MQIVNVLDLCCQELKHETPRKNTKDFASFVCYGVTLEEQSRAGHFSNFQMFDLRQQENKTEKL